MIDVTKAGHRGTLCSFRWVRDWCYCRQLSKRKWLHYRGQ